MEQNCSFYLYSRLPFIQASTVQNTQWYSTILETNIYYLHLLWPQEGFCANTSGFYVEFCSIMYNIFYFKCLPVKPWRNSFLCFSMFLVTHISIFAPKPTQILFCWFLYFEQAIELSLNYAYGSTYAYGLKNYASLKVITCSHETQVIEDQL